MKKIFLLFSFFIILSANNFDKYFSFAQNYYWLTVDENIGSRVYMKTLKYIKLAKLENEKLKSVDIAQYNLNKQKIISLENELSTFYNIHIYTMRGFFPLLNFISTSFYFLPKKSRKYTLQKPADIIAAEEASDALTGKISEMVSDLSQYHIFFNSSNMSWNEIAFDKFNSHGAFYVHLLQEVEDAFGFNKDLINKFYTNDIDKNILNHLLTYADQDALCLVRLEKTPLEKGDSYFSAYGELYDKKGLEKYKSSAVSGYAIDMRWSWSWMIVIHTLLFVLVMGATYFYVKAYGLKMLDTFVIAFIGFLTGRVLPWIIIPSIETFMPNEELYILYTIWWIALAGVAVMIVPIYGINLVYSKLSQYVKLPNLAGKGGIIGLSVGAGIIGYLSVGYIFNFGLLVSFASFLATFVLFSIAVLTSTYVIGLVLEPMHKISELNLIYFVLLDTLLFIAFLHGDFMWIDIASVFVIIVSLIILFVNKNKLKKEVKQIDVETPKENINIKEAIENPPFYKFNFDKGKK